MTKPVRFKESDMKRALKAAREAGHKVTRVRIAPDGAIELDFTAGSQPVNPLDEWLLKDDARQAQGN